MGQFLKLTHYRELRGILSREKLEFPGHVWRASSQSAEESRTNAGISRIIRTDALDNAR